MNLERGFLPVDDPIPDLPRDYQGWDELGKELPKLLLSDHLKTTFENMPILSVARLQSAPELSRAMMLLSFFGHAYIWGEKKCPDKIPASIAIPWFEVSQKLGRPPVLSYDSYALNNWRRLDVNRPIELGNIVLSQNFLGGIDEEWFVLVHIDIEMKASQALQLFLPLQEAINQQNETLVAQYLGEIIQHLEKMCDTLDRMTEHCDPYIYYNRVRPYIHGWKDNPALPLGVIYEGVEVFDNQPQQFRGETGAQSSIIPSFDALFGIEHRPDPLRLYLAEMREYMPVAHRDFIGTIEQNVSIREYILTSHKDDINLRENYNAGINLLARFRQTHLNFAAHYIQKQSQTSLANPTGIGTGGTPFMEYLKKHKDETSQFLI
ncbi:MAG: hypothetical protein H0U71_02540 [Gammaproteobacteria bacterium]|nr:hypothetical protein [Gammaproteobacteria bacterium]